MSHYDVDGGRKPDDDGGNNLCFFPTVIRRFDHDDALKKSFLFQQGAHASKRISLLARQKIVSNT